MSFKVVIPARYGSIRLSGKPLLEIAGKPLIQHVYESACLSQAEQVIVATDDERIAECVKSFNGTALMTAGEHQSGTDRLAEVVAQMGWADDTLLVNVQGDEFALPAQLIDQLAEAMLKNKQEVMATLYEKIESHEDGLNPSVVKVVVGKDNRAIYFSRSQIPWQDKPGRPLNRHIGLYAYRAGFLKEFTALAPCALEQSERLEQLRAIYHGYRIYVVEACTECGIGIDTEADLERARSQLHDGP